MGIKPHWYIVALVVFLAAPTVAQDLEPAAHPEELGFSPERLETITRAYQSRVDAGELPGAVLLIARDNKIVYLQTLGYQDRAANMPMHVDSIFPIASMTKPFTSMAAMMLAEEGKLDIAAPVSQYLPELKDLKVMGRKINTITGELEVPFEVERVPMSVQDLLRHTSGLVYGQFGDGPVHRAYRAAHILDPNDTLADTITKLAKIPLAHQPGEAWEYSVSTDVLGRVVEVVSGMPLDRFFETRIMNPLGLTATGFSVSADNLTRLARPAPPPTGAQPSLPDDLTPPKLLSGGGGLFSTATDYLKFCEMLLNGGALNDVRLIAPKTVALMTSDAVPPGVLPSTESVLATTTIVPSPRNGLGFGLGLAVRTAQGRNSSPGSVGSYFWLGASGPAFFIDPAEKLIAIQMIRVPIGDVLRYQRLFQTLVYQALTEP